MAILALLKRLMVAQQGVTGFPNGETVDDSRHQQTDYQMGMKDNTDAARRSVALLTYEHCFTC